MGLTLAEVEASTDEILVFAELRDFARLELKHFSSGMAVRLAYAVAFRAVRDVLILDEVFAVGDFGFRQACHQRFRRLHEQGHSMILVSHDAEEIRRFCDRALLLEAGRVSLEGTGDEVATAYTELLERAVVR
jgi:ABC-type polysaccharide/polyol phosphate transport system ATPase subunit